MSFSALSQHNLHYNTYYSNGHEMRGMRSGADLAFIIAAIGKFHWIYAQSPFTRTIVVENFNAMRSGVDEIVDS